MVKMLEQLEKAAGRFQSTEDKQKKISAIEAGHIWDKLLARYDVIEATNLYRNLAQDTDLKLVIDRGLQVLNRQARQLERMAKEYGITLPMRPPVDSESVVKVDSITDRFIFREIYSGIQSFLPLHMVAFIQAVSPNLREEFRRLLTQEMELYDKFFEYGKLKGWIAEPPAFRI